jgi:crotonobetainyl-CoA:carnitine CoA-transferase CaiB-like acyl-CoA transferase
MLDRLESEFPESERRDPSKPLALQGVRVLEIAHFLAAPLAGMILADMGAEVIKVEPPGDGDGFRAYPPVIPEMQGGPFLWSNRNKKSITLDLKSPKGIEVALEMIKTADVVLENFSSGVMDRLGLGYERCKEVNPRLVYCSVSAYGRDGEFSDRLGFDPITQAESGFISMNGYADRPGVRSLSPVMDISCAMMVSNAILGALFARTQTGTGQAVEVALYDTAILMTGYAAMQHLLTGVEPQRNGNTSPDTCPSGVFEAQDCSFYINCGSTTIFKRLMSQVLERPDMAEHPDYATPPQRVARREEIFAVLREAFAAKPWAHWRDRMRAAGVPSGQARTLDQALRAPETRARRLVTRVAHPTLGWVPNIASPIRYSGTPLADPVPSPLAGEHSSELLASLGYTAAQVAQLADDGAFGAARSRTKQPQTEPG